MERSFQLLSWNSRTSIVDSGSLIDSILPTLGDILNDVEDVKIKTLSLRRLKTYFYNKKLPTY